MNKLVLLIFFLSAPLMLQAQAHEISLSGVVCNDSSQVIANAKVQLLDKNSSIVSTVESQTDGQFRLKCKKYKEGDYLLSIEASGFFTRILDLRSLSRDVDLGEIKLDSMSVALDEVVVKGSNRVRKEDKMLLFPTVIQKKYANDSYTLLQNLNIPKLKVDFLSGKVTALGGDVEILINGRKASEQELKMLRPKDVERVEYHDLPQGEFTDKNYVVDFITVKQTSGGYIGTVANQNLQGIDGNYILSAKVNHKNSEFIFVGAANYLHDKNVYSNRAETFSNGLVQTMEGIPALDKSQTYSGYLGYNYETKKRSIGINGGYTYDLKPLLPSYYKLYSSFDNTKTPTQQETDRNSHTAYGYFFLRNQFKNESVLRTDAYITYSQNEYTRNYSEGDYASRLHANENYYNATVALHYNLTFKDKSSLFIQFADFTKFSKILYQSKNSANDNLLNNDIILYAFYTYHLGKKWTVQGRLGATLQIYGQANQDNITLFTFRPAILLQYRPNQKLQFKLESYVGNSSPELNYFNSTEQSIDRWQVRRGNPDLEKTTYWTTKINIWNQLLGGELQSFVQYGVAYNNIKNHTLFENNKYIQTYVTEGNYHELQIDLSYSRNLWNSFMFQLSGGWQHTSVTGLNAAGCSSFYGSCSVSYSQKGFNVGIQGSTVTNRLSNELIRSHSSAYILPYVAYYWKNLSVMAYYTNPFWKRNNSKWMDTGLYQTKSYSFDSRSDHYFCLRLSWNISFGRKYNYTDAQIQEKKSAIINVEK